MSASGAPALEFDVNDVSIAIVAASWHQEIMDGLIAGAQRVLSDSGVEFEIFRVPFLCG